MAKSVLTQHNLPDIHDEGKIKRYGVFIAYAVVTIALLLFVFWATSVGWNNQFGPNGPSHQPESGGSAPH